MNVMFPHGQNPATGEGLPDPADKTAQAVPIVRRMMQSMHNLWDGMDALEDLLHLEWTDLTEDLGVLSASWDGRPDSVTREQVEWLIAQAQKDD